MTQSQTKGAFISNQELSRRVCGEYLEMPGLQLTLPQVCRLWNTNAETGRHVMDTLVASCFLRRSGQQYVLGNVLRRSA